MVVEYAAIVEYAVEYVVIEGAVVEEVVGAAVGRPDNRQDLTRFE